MPPALAIRQLINTPEGLLPVTEERARLPLPGCPGDEKSHLRYGSYLNALSEFLSKASCSALQTALSSHLGRPIERHEWERVELISEKHGALYHVARLRAFLTGRTVSLAVNVAVSPEQQAFLENEYELLGELKKTSRRQFLPTPYLLGEATYDAAEHGQWPLRLFIAEWFDGYHEFHLSPVQEGTYPIIKLWDNGTVFRPLDEEQTFSLYRQAAAILTHYLDEVSFRQIYPWHHAAGDFVVKQQDREVDLRLITVRDYRCLLSPGSKFADLWIAIFHFFLNLSLRMRLDRFDGTGELAWASPNCLRGVLAGFLQAWTIKAREHSFLPSEEQVRDVLRSFNASEWLPVAEAVMESGLVEADEIEFLRPHLKDHVASLVAMLREEISDVRQQTGE